MKRITIEVSTWTDRPNDAHMYYLTGCHAGMFYWKISNGAIHYYSKITGFKSRAAALNNAKSVKKMYKKLGMI